MSVDLRIEGRAGRITLTRPEALNALSPAMSLAIERALIGWQDDPAVALVLIDAAGPRAFCAGGDVAQIHAEGVQGNFGFGRAFWRQEYRMNARIAAYPKPVVTLMHGFCMGGGVGLGCHASHRIVGGTTQMAMPECAIGLVPDVGGTRLLARAPGRLGAYLGTTGRRMGPGDAICAGFADHYLPEADWPALIETLCTGALAIPAAEPPPATLPALRPEIDRHFASYDLSAILQSLQSSDTAFAAETLKTLERGSPLAIAATLEILRRLGPYPSLREALEMEFRFTFRAQGEADLLEGVRAAIIDKDRSPRWKHADAAALPQGLVDHLLAPLGEDRLTFEEEQ